jgi:hypothetical protein
MEFGLILTGIILIINLVISYFNATSVGSIWFESKVIGGWSRILAYCGAIMSACGFSYVYAIVIGGICYLFGVLTIESFNAMLSLVYIFIIIPVIGTGIAITVNSLIVAYHRRTWTNMGIAAWNVLAQASNMYSAITTIPSALKSVGEIFKGGGNKDSLQVKLIILIAAFSLFGGIITTIYIVRKTAKAHAIAAKNLYGKQQMGQNPTQI